MTFKNNKAILNDRSDITVKHTVAMTRKWLKIVMRVKKKKIISL